jgi:hypothetical protein
VPAKDRRNAWTLGGIAIDQVSKYKYLGVVYQEDGSWHTRKGAKDASSLWVLEATAVMQQSADKGQCSWFRPSSIPRSCMARKCGDEGGQRQDVSGRKALRSILALHPETALLTFCTGTLGYFTRCTH